MAYIFETTSGEKIEAHPSPYSSEQIDMALGKALESVRMQRYSALVRKADWKPASEGCTAIISVPGLTANDNSLLIVGADMASIDNVEQLLKTAFTIDTWLKAGCSAEGELTIYASTASTIDVPIRIHVLKE